ncbi:MAG: hypothetical protein HOI51_00285 [Nitrosomonadales bacterium]|nr:hypothetical protein [Nitrosomonadales bacterium]
MFKIDFLTLSNIKSLSLCAPPKGSLIISSIILKSKRFFADNFIAFAASKVFIGSDSFTTKNKVNFASAICLYGGQAPSRYFFAREYLPQDNFNALVTRITEEVRRSVELAEHIMTNHDVNSDNIELHIDVSPFHMKNGTSKYCDMLKGYVTGAGFECRVKPQAWASQSVADKHSK